MGDALSHARDREEEEIKNLQKKIMTESDIAVKLSSIIIISNKITEANNKIQELTETRNDLVDQLRELVVGEKS